MSSINFRLYGDQIYGLAISKLKDKITPEMTKEEFTSNFKEGKIEYSNIKNINKFTLNPQISINNLQIQKILMKIPNETENFGMDISGIKTELELFDINEDDIEKLLINKRKDLINKFIEYAVKKIENKEASKSFVEGLVENLINRALNGLMINISDIELKIKYKNILFIFNLEKIEYSEENGLAIKNISISYLNLEKDKKQDYIIKQFSIELNIEAIKEENEYNNINIKMSNFEYKLTKNILEAFNEFFNLAMNTKYKYIYVRKKKLIQYYKPIKPEFNENTDISEKNKYYHSLWLYAIKTVIKLQKCIGYEKLYLLDLNEFIQSKISKNFIKNENKNENDEKIILPTEINLITNTKEKVEQKVLDGKKGNALANAFSFFFGGSKAEEKKELTEEEKSRFENIYTENELYKYLNGKSDNGKSSDNPIKEKIIKFISNLKINFTFSKFELVLANDEINICKFYIEGITFTIIKKGENRNISINIKDIGSNMGEKLFDERKKINDNDDLIMVNISENNKIKIDFGFNSIQFSEPLLNFFITFFSNIKFKTKNTIFKDIKYNYQENKEEKKEEDKDKDNNEVMDNFSISNIPSFIISSNDNKIRFSVIKYCISKTKIEISCKINDSFGTIMDNYTFIFNKDDINNKYSFNLDFPLKIILSSESSKSIFISCLKLKERIKQIQKRNKSNCDKINNKEEKENELFNFNYTVHKKLDIKNFDINKLNIELSFEKIIFEIYENKVKSKFSIHGLNIKYANKDLTFKLEKLSIKTNLMSTMVLYLLNFESPNFFLFQDYIDQIQDEYKNNEINNELIEKLEEKKEISNIKYEFNIDYFLNIFTIYINNLSLKFQSEDNIISYSINKINVKKEDENILINIGNLALQYKQEGAQIVKIFNIDKGISVTLTPKQNLLSIKISNPNLNIKLDALNNIRRSYQFLLEQLDMEVVLCKADVLIENSFIKLNNEFSLSISQISLKNYDGDKLDTLYLTINDLIVKNKKDEKIIQQNSINLKMITHSIKKYEVILSLSDIYINISKEDIKNILLIINQVKNNQNKFISKQTKHYIQKTNIKKSQEITFIFDAKLPILDFSLYDSQNKNKKLELILSRIESNSNFYIPEEKGKPPKKNINFNIGRINIISEQNNGDEYNILEYKENMSINFESKSIINFGSNSSLKNQIELTMNNENELNKNDFLINMNKFCFNIRPDIIFNLLLFFKECIPQNEKVEEQINEVNENNEDDIDKNNIKINLNNIEIILESLNNDNGNMFINFNKISVNSISKESQEIKLDKFLISLSNNKDLINIIQTKEETDFLVLKIEKENQIKKISANIEEILINFTFKDINLLKEFINSNKKFFEKNKKLLINDDKKENNNKDKANKLFEINLILNKIDITLIDDYSNNNFPFLNFNIINSNIALSDKKELITSSSIALSTYNYISSTWEPIIEKSLIQLSIFQLKDLNSIKIEIPEILINISDMFIASTYLSIKNLTNILKKNRLDNMNNNKFSEQKSISRISYSVNSILSSTLENEFDLISQKKTFTNNNLINHTGVPFKYKYEDEIYECPIDSETNLINNEKKNNKKLIEIYFDDKTIKIPLTEFGNKVYNLFNFNYIVIENVITKNRQINIKIYSPYIFKNKTNCTYQIKLINPTLTNLFILLKPNSCSGIPLSYCNNKTSFNIKLIDNDINNDKETSDLINLADIINMPNYNKKINLEKASFNLKLQKKIEKVNTLLITNEYKIINCLPCDLYIKANDSNKKSKIKKCSQFWLDFSNNITNIKLEIKVGINDTFYSNIKLEQLFTINKKSDGKNYLKFINKKGESFYLSFICRDKESYKGLIIYSEYILHNDSGFVFSFLGKTVFNVAKSIYIITNNINLTEKNINISSAFFNYSQILSITDIIKASPYYEIYLNNRNNNIILPLTKKISSIPIKNNHNFTPNIFSMIFYISPSCKITNLLMNKKLIIRNFDDESQSCIIPPLNQVSFNFFNKNKNNLYLELSLININETKSDKINILNTFQTGIYTFYSKNEFYNIEIKSSSTDGFLNIFITEANLDTAKILVINKTEIELNIYQKKYEKYKQIIKGNDTQILNIHDQVYTDFIAEINGKEFDIKFIPFKEIFDITEVDNDHLLVKESNGVKMKIQLYNKSDFYRMNNDEKALNLNLLINNCFISIIGDNYKKNKNLRNYERKEILLFYIKNINTKANIKKESSIVHKNNLKLSFIIQQFEIYNQLSKKGKFACIFKNVEMPFVNFNQDLDIYTTDKVAKINNFNLIFTKQKLCLEPGFLFQILFFIENIKYRLGKINSNIDKIFLRNDKNIRDIKLKNNFTKYKITQKMICFGSKINFPEINIDFEITQTNFENLLQHKLGVPYFIVWVLLGLSNYNQNIHIEKAVINNYFGDFSRLFQKAGLNYATKAVGPALNLGIKGIFGQIKNLFWNIKNDLNSVEVVKNRIRYPRAFYGKYRAIKNYSEQDAKIIDMVNNLFKNEFKNIYCDYLIWNRKYIFYFSGEALFIFTHKFELHYKLEYNSINNIYNNNENLIIKYKKENGEVIPSSIIDCENEKVAEKIVDYLKNYLNKNYI